MKRCLVFLSIAILTLGIAGEVQAKPKSTPRYGILSISDRLQNGNNWEIWQDNLGKDIAPQSGSRPGGYWPKGSGRNYIFGGGMWVGSIDTTAGFEDTLVSWGYNPNAGQSEFGPCSPNGNDSTGETDPLARVYLSTDPLDRAVWPVRDSLGRPVYQSMQDAWAIYNDVNPKFRVMPDSAMGVQIIRHVYTWQFAGLADIVFYSWDIKNVTKRVRRYQPNGIPLKRVILGECIDADIGNESGTGANDLDFLDNTKYYSPIRGDSITRNLAVQYQLVQEPGWSIPPPYFVGFRFLEGPINNRGQTIQIRSQPGIGYPEYDRDILPGQPLGMTAFQIFTLSVDPPTAWARYMELAGYYYQTPTVYNAYQKDTFGPSDKRFLQSSGPFDLPVDSTVHIVMAVIGGSDSLGILQASDRAQDIYDNWRHPVRWVHVTSPNGGEIVSGNTPITWTSNGVGSDSMDIYFTRDGGINWDTIAVNRPNTGTYLWNTTLRPDGTRYMIGLFLHNASIAAWDYSDSIFTVNNPGNAPPDVQLYAPFGGEVWSDTQNVLWYAKDPDGDTLDINLRYSSDGGGTWQGLASHVPNTGRYAWNTWTYPNDTKYLVAVSASDGQYLIGDTSGGTFTIDNNHPPAGTVNHDSGGATTVAINPYVVDPPRVTGHRYRIRFMPIGKVNDTTALYSYDMWDLDTGQRVITDRATAVIQNNTLIIDNAPVVDGLRVEMQHRVNKWTFWSGRVTIVTGNYPDSAQADTAASYGRFGFTPVPWPFRGTLFRLTWHKATGSKGDSLWVAVRDSTNHVDVPPETLAVRPGASVSGWCFGGNTTRSGKLYMDSTMVNILGGVDTIPIPKRYPGTWLTLCGRRYWFAGKLGGYDGRPMRWPGGVCPINDGDVWLIQPSGDRPPHDGDVYTFQTQVGVEEAGSSERFAFSLGQAYPNPAHGGNVIPFSLEKKGRTCLKIYNVTGALVRTLVDGEMGAGRYQAPWDGRNNCGKQTASGVYLYKLEAPGRTAVKKMVVLR